MDQSETLRLISEVYNAVFDNSESFEVDNIGADLAYLMGTMLQQHRSGCEWPEDRAIVGILRESLPADHPVWKYVELA